MSVAVVGVAESDLGVTGRSVLGLQTQAVTRALADAGLTLADVDGLATTGVARFSTTQLADYLGITRPGRTHLRRRQRLRDVRRAPPRPSSPASARRSSSRSRRTSGRRAVASLGGVSRPTPPRPSSRGRTPAPPVSDYGMAAAVSTSTGRRRASSSPRSRWPPASGRC